MITVIYPDQTSVRMSEEVFKEFEPIDVFMNFLARGITWEINWNLCKPSGNVVQKIFKADEIARSCAKGGADVRVFH